MTLSDSCRLCTFLFSLSVPLSFSFHSFSYLFSCPVVGSPYCPVIPVQRSSYLMITHAKLFFEIDDNILLDPSSLVLYGLYWNLYARSSNMDPFRTFYCIIMVC